MGAPTVAAVFEDVLPYLGVEPEYTDAEISRVNVTMPDVTGLTESAAAKLLADKSLEYRIIGNGDKIVSQIPAAGRRFPVNPPYCCIPTIPCRQIRSRYRT